MRNKFSLSPSDWRSNGLAILRIITGLLMAYHGWELFDSRKINEYLQWDMIKQLPVPVYMLYLGKGLELVSGVLLTIGLFTRFAALFMAVIMLFICFKIGDGKFYYGDQHPFLFAMLAMVFFFTGPVKWSIDQIDFKNKSTYHSY